MFKTATQVNTHIVVLLAILEHSFLSTAAPTVLGVVTLGVNTLQFRHSTHQSLSELNVLAIVLLLMLLISGMNSLIMYAAQLQLPPSGKSSNLLYAKSLTAIASPVIPVSPWCL